MERRTILAGALAAAICGLGVSLQAGGSGLNTLVVINQNSAASCEVGNYFCERRQVPPENVLYIHWTGGNTCWNNTDFQSVLLNPLLQMLSSRLLSSQVDYVVLSMDIPFTTLNGVDANSTTSALYYGLKSSSGLASIGNTNSYAGSEQIFRRAPPASSPGYSFFTTMITSSSVAAAKHMVDQGVASDGTFPSAPVILARSTDTLRNVRYLEFDNAIFNARVRGSSALLRTNGDCVSCFTNILGFETGLDSFSICPNTFVPGAMADSMTSYGGIIFGGGGQTTLLAFINAGASGAYGTVTEPTPDTDKFPNPLVYFYQARGYSLAECYYQGLNVPYQGLIVGEPLAAPFQVAGSGAWLNVASNAVLSGTAPLSLRFDAADGTRPLQQVDLFIDGKYSRTLTNLSPLPGNVLTLTLDGHSLAYTVPAGASLASIATAVGALVNAWGRTNGVQATASVFGDRVELHSLATNRPGPPQNMRVSSGSAGTNAVPPAPLPLVGSVAGAASGLTTFLAASRNVFLNSSAYGAKGCTVGGTPQVGTWLQINVTKTSGARVSLAVTNQSPTATIFDLATQLVNAVNASPALQTTDGIAAGDLVSSLFVGSSFNLRPQLPGLGAAGVRVRLAGSPGLMLNPATDTAVADNLSDLRPRNHLYVAAGATNLAFTLSLDTTALADGYHELTAVAYEGSHVRTQTKITVPVTVRNSTLSAALTPLDFGSTASVQGTYHIQVTANTNNVSTISLFSTGGLLASSSNQASTTFTINAAALGVGLHPFYAIVQTPGGVAYHTAPQEVRFQ